MTKIVWKKFEIMEATKGEDVSKKFLQKKKVTGISIDTRSLKKGDLFIALAGENFNGHDYVNVALKNGASGIIVSNKVIAKKHSGLYVSNTREALKNLAIFSRNRFQGWVVAITGSNGKTSTKNMMASIFKHFGKTHSTFQNNNNILGLSLTLSRLRKDDKFCVLELGMSQKKELKILSDLALPHIAMITNISSSHIENFLSEKEIAYEKCNIFSGLTKNGRIILNADDKWIDLLKEKAKKFTSKVYTYGEKPNSNMKIENLYSKKFGTVLSFGKTELFLKYLPKHYALNLSGICLVMKLLNLNYKNKIEEISNLKPSNGRGNIFKIVKGKNCSISIINDSYNSNLSSMTSSLENIKILQKNQPKKKFVLIIGDMLELGKHSKNSHKKLIPIIQEINPRCLLTVGNFSKIISESLKTKVCCYSFNNVEELNNSFFSIIKNQDTILIKGSNGTGLFNFTNYLYETFLLRS